MTRFIFSSIAIFPKKADIFKNTRTASVICVAELVGLGITATGENHFSYYDIV